MVFLEDKSASSKFKRCKTLCASIAGKVVLGFLFFLFSTLSNPALSNTHITNTDVSNTTITYITNLTSKNPSDIATSFLLDDTGLTINEILQEEYQQQFKPNESYPINFGFESSTAWIKITYQDERTFPYHKDLILEISYSILDHIEIFRPSKKGLISFQTGALEDYKLREIKSDAFLFYLPDAVIEPTTIYLKVRSETPLIIPLKVKSVHSGFASGNLISFGGRTLTIVMALIILYNLLLSFTQREAEQYYYVVWYSLATISASIVMGTAQPFLGNAGVWFTEKLLATGSLAATFFLLHTAAYVQLKSFHPSLNKLIILLATVFAINSLFVFVSDYRLWKWTMFTCGIPVTVGLGLIGYGVYLKQKMAWIGVTVFSPIFIGPFIYILTAANMFPSNWLTINSVFIGIVVVGITKALTEGTRINQEKSKSLNLAQQNRKALEAHNALLKKTNAIKDDFLGTISHELRTPLNGASGALALLEWTFQETGQEHNRAGPDEVDGLFKIINRSINEMISLINSIISFSELQIEHSKVNPDYFSPYKSITSMIRLRQSEIKNSNIDLRVSIDSLSAIEVISDEEKCKKIIGIIFDNAIKFTQDGSITIQGSIEKPDNESTSLIVSITDTGVGIPTSDFERIMEPFSQADQSYTRQYGGLGIGLAVCKKTLALIGGELKMTSEPGKGTCIQLIFDISGFRTVDELPPNRERHISDPPEVTLTKKAMADLHVLLVEDNETNQFITERMLQKMGLVPLVAKNGAIAVDLFREKKIDLILMDCQMPVMDGFEATRQIRGLSTDTDFIPIIAVTANTSDEDQRKCKESGMNDFLAKPITYEALSITVEKWAEKRVAMNIRT